MAAFARVGDIVTGTCDEHGDFTGTWITGSPDVSANDQAIVRVGDVGVADCGHIFTAVEGSVAHFANGISVHLVGHIVVCEAGGVGVTMTGSPSVNDCMQAPGITGSAVVAVAPGEYALGNDKIFDNSAAGCAGLRKHEESTAPGVATGNHEDSTSTAPPSGTPPVTPSAPPINPVQVECANFPSIILPEHMAYAVSANFTLGKCKHIPVAQVGLTAGQIACNWKALCINVLDPIYAQFKFNFNSGFRSLQHNANSNGSVKSDHLKGCAADISDGSAQANVAMFKWILYSGLPFSQLIYEGNWVHVAFNGNPKDAARVMYTFNGKNPIAAGRNGENLPSSLA